MQLAKRYDWVLGFGDETWWSRVATPSVHAWSAAKEPLHLVEQPVVSADNEPKALACYGLLVSHSHSEAGGQESIWLRFVEGRPVSELTMAFLEWSCQKIEQLGKKVLALIWENAGWHVSRRLRRCITEHNRAVKKAGRGVRILVCQLPTTSPWLNPIEPYWAHGKHQVVEPNGRVPAGELERGVCAYFDCPLEDHLVIPKQAA